MIIAFHAADVTKEEMAYAILEADGTINILKKTRTFLRRGELRNSLRSLKTLGINGYASISFVRLIRLGFE